MARQIAADVLLYALAILALGVATAALVALARDLYRAFLRWVDRSEDDLPDASDQPDFDLAA